MNLLVRFFYQILVSFLSSPIKVNDVDSCYMRVLPNDLDLNFHLNNGRFLSLMDLGRTRLSIRSGLYKKSREENWGMGVVGGLSITYLKSLAPLQKFKLKSKLAGHFDGWFFIEQRFESKGKLVAAALVKVTFLREGKRVPAKEIMMKMGVDHIGENKEYLEHLFNSEKEFLQYVKKDY